ncbi:MAG TPA: 3-deoxy-manno-octulosonate cytidylyltransferase [Candidatus Paceibacterota bacterium]|nr:3-deoxy-manno-octulosonate cytidylyltransferase [Candidatus Paceibacterota bacterium]
MQDRRAKTIGIIPARLASTRLLHKPLLDIAGKSLVQRSWEQALQARLLDKVVVAVDDERVFKEVTSFGGEAMMTSVECQTGTDRVAEAARHFPEAEVIVNVQGDQPLVPPQAIDEVAKAMQENPEIEISNLVAKASREDAENPSVVKIVQDRQGFALYCSRSPIPYPRNEEFCSWYKIMDVYGFRPAALQKIAALPPTSLEKAESVEQLRILEHGYKIKLVETPCDFIGVNTPEDLEKVRALLSHGES